MTPATDPLLAALRTHRSSIRRVRYRTNRTVLLSVSRDGRTLNSHACFQHAPPEIAEAVARFLTARRGSAAARQALERLRNWEGTRRGLETARRERPPTSRPTTDGPDTAPLRALFDRLNRQRFGNRLPDIPLRVSRRMTRSLGTIRYALDEGPAAPRNGASSNGGEAGRPRPPGEGAKPRSVAEIAISADLLLPRNRAALEDTMLHEMAHAEAWLHHGHRGHGTPWRRVALRVGCVPRATCRTPIARRRPRPGPGGPAIRRR